MRAIFSLILLYISSLSVFASEQDFHLVSGFDDVLKQAENQNLLKAAIRLFQTEKTFTGMPELYQELTKNKKEESKFFLISGTSHWFLESSRKFIESSHYPQAQYFFRNWLTEWSITDFKINSIHSALSSFPEGKMIVIFDNSGASQNLARLIPEKFPGQVLAIYLRQTVQRPETPGAMQFVTAFEVGLEEWKKGRISSFGLDRITQVILNEKNPKKLIPAYAFCPKDYNPCVQAELTNCHSVRTKVRAICESR